MADVLMGPTQFANWLSTVFAPAVEATFRHKRTLSNYLTDMSGMLAGSKAVYVRASTAVTAETRGAGGETALFYTGNTESGVTLTVDQYGAVAHLITDVAKFQITPDLQDHYIDASVYSLLTAFESYMVDTVITGATTNDEALATANTITWADFTAALAKLLDDNAYEQGEMAFGLNATAWGLSIADWGEKYTHVSAVGKDTFLTNGVIGMLAGVPLYVTSHFAATASTGIETGAIWNRQAVIYGIQNAFGIIGPVPDPLRGGTGFSVELYYGGARLREPGIANFTNP